MLPLRSCEQIPQKGHVGNAGFGVPTQRYPSFVCAMALTRPEIPSFAVHDVCDNWLIDLLGLSEAAPAVRLATAAISVQIRQESEQRTRSIIQLEFVRRLMSDPCLFES